MGNIINLSVGDDGTVVAIDNTQSVWARPANMTEWRVYDGAKAMQATCARQDHIWVLNAAGDPFQRLNNQWIPQRLSVKLVDISTGSDGTVWGVDRNMGLWFRSHASPNWTQEKQGKAMQVAVGGAAHVWSLTSTGDIFQWQNNTWNLRKKTSGATNISVGNDGALWYVGPGGKLFRPQGGDWVPDQQGVAMQISVRNNNEVWAVTFSGDIWQMLNNRWSQIPAPTKSTTPSTGSGGGAVVVAPTPSGKTRTYQVKQGETTGLLAQRFGVVLTELLKANPQLKNPNVIGVGQLLNIPIINTTYKVYNIQPGDTMGAISQRFGVVYPRLLQANPHFTNPDLVNVGDTVYIPPA